MDAREKRMLDAAAADAAARLESPELFDDPDAESTQTRRDPQAPARPAPRPRNVPSQLTSLSHAIPEDAADELARVLPARWRLRVHMHDPEAFEAAMQRGEVPEAARDENNELHGYVCVHKAIPVAHCTPDVLAWLHARGFVGTLLLEWLPPQGGGPQGKTLRHFVYIAPREGAKSPDAAPPAALGPPPSRPASQSDLVLQMVETQRQEGAALRELILEQQRQAAAQLDKVLENTRHALNDMRDGFRETLENDPLRKVGALVQQKVTDRIVNDLGGPPADPFAFLGEQLEKLEANKLKLAKFFTDPEKRAQVDPLAEKMNTALLEIGLGYARQKLGLSQISPAQASNLAQGLEALNREGDKILGTLDGGAAA